MAAFDLEEQEQLSSIKAWWQQYGNLVTALLLAGALAAFGWQGWNWYQRGQATKAGTLLATVEKSVAARDALHAREAAGELLDKYAGTAQAGFAALLSARLQADAGDLKTAKAQLSWAAGNATEAEVRDLARLRLAALLTDEKAFDEALKQLVAEPTAQFAANFAEARGDVLAIQGKKAEAKAAYQAALAKRVDGEGADASELRRQKAAREMLEIKLASVGGAQ